MGIGGSGDEINCIILFPQIFAPHSLNNDDPLSSNKAFNRPVIPMSDDYYGAVLIFLQGVGQNLRIILGHTGEEGKAFFNKIRTK